MKICKEKEGYSLTVSYDEALILFSCLSREFDFLNKDRIEFEHRAEEIVFWDMNSVLEEEIAGTYSFEFTKFLENARKSILQKYGDEILGDHKKGNHREL